MPTIDEQRDFKPIRITVGIPNPGYPRCGFRFQSRCAFADERCRIEVPDWRELAPEPFVACRRAKELARPEAGRPSDRLREEG